MIRGRCHEQAPLRRRSSTMPKPVPLMLVALMASIKAGSSFMSPTIVANTRAAVVRHGRACSTSSPSKKTCWAIGATLDGSSDSKEPVSSADTTAVAAQEAEEIEEEEEGDDVVKSPAGLSLEGVYKRLKLETQGFDDGVMGLESKDPKFGVEIVKVVMPREPSLGMQLEEVARGGDGRGLVLVAGTVPGGNAEATGKIFVGDSLCRVGVPPDRMTRTEALDWDQTVDVLGDFSRESEITLIIKRLVKREAINVTFELPSGSREHEIKAGSNLRGEMIRLGIPVYDPKTKRYDQPYATGNCAGEGTCGTCFVEIQEGAELLSSPDGEEKMLLSKGSLPLRWRLSCKAIVGRENVSGTMRVKAVPQAQRGD